MGVRTDWRAPEIGDGGTGNVGVFRMDYNPANMVGFFQSHVAPCFPAVGRLVYPFTPVIAVPEICLPGADPYDTGIGGRDSNIADGKGVLVVKYRFKCGTVVYGLPQPTRGCRNIEGPQLLFGNSKIGHSSALFGRANLSEMEMF